jgi:hypothetical protein
VFPTFYSSLFHVSIGFILFYFFFLVFPNILLHRDYFLFFSLISLFSFPILSLFPPLHQQASFQYASWCAKATYKHVFVSVIILKQGINKINVSAVRIMGHNLCILQSSCLPVLPSDFRTRNEATLIALIPPMANLGA